MSKVEVGDLVEWRATSEIKIVVCRDLFCGRRVANGGCLTFRTCGVLKTNSFFEPRREHSFDDRDARPIMRSGVYAATRQGLALIGPSTAACLRGVGQRAYGGGQFQSGAFRAFSLGS